MAEALIDLLAGLFEKNKFRRGKWHHTATEIDSSGLFFFCPDGPGHQDGSFRGWYARFWRLSPEKYGAEVSRCTWNKDEVVSINHSVNCLELRIEHLHSPNFMLDIFISSLLAPVKQKLKQAYFDHRTKRWRV